MTVFDKITASPESLAAFITGMMVLAVTAPPEDWNQVRRQQLDGLLSEVEN